MPDDAPKKKILVVDDDKTLAQSTAEILEHVGYETYTAFSGEEALEKFRADPPDLVILDVAMPGMNGFDVAVEMRKIEPEENRTKIVILTAYSQSFLFYSQVEARITSYLTKPLMLKELVEHVNRLLY